MLMLYFSGTGNSKYIAEVFCKKMNAKCYSIEDKVDFDSLINGEDIIGFCYPIYCAKPPRIVREFAEKHIKAFENKKLIIFCTQYMFSGDGARSFIDLFAENPPEVLYAEHFLMPNNLNNFLPVSGERSKKRYMKRAERKLHVICDNIKSGIVKKRGFNALSKLFGAMEGSFAPKMESAARNAIKINKNCTQCGLCVSICPTHNYIYENEKIAVKQNCTLCYRCINKCPQKAISIFLHHKVKKQYTGF